MAPAEAVAAPLIAFRMGLDPSPTIPPLFGADGALEIDMDRLLLENRWEWGAPPSLDAKEGKRTK
jgi:hypothetical protein